MKRILFTLMLCIALAPSGRADFDAGGMLDSAMKVGAKLLEKEAQKLDEDPDMSPETKKIASGVLSVGAKLLEKQRQDMQEEGQHAEQAQSPQEEDETSAWESLGAQLIGRAVKSGWDAGMTDFKEEVRREQKELADDLNARVEDQAAANERMQTAMQSMQWLCWSMLTVLSFVLIAVVGLFWYIHTLRRRLEQQGR